MYIASIYTYVSESSLLQISETEERYYKAMNKITNFLDPSNDNIKIRGRRCEPYEMPNKPSISPFFLQHAP